MGRVLYRLGWWLGGGVPVMGIEWCSCGRKFSLLGGAVLGTGKNSPAREKWPVFVDCGHAGRVLYRLGFEVGVVGRVLYRLGWWLGGGVPVMGIEWCSCGRKFSLLGGAALETRKSSPCSGKMARFWCFWACWASFFAVWPGLGCCWASFFARERLEGRAGRTFSRGDAKVAGCSNVIACWRHPVKRRHWPSRENTTRSCVATAPVTRSCVATAPVTRSCAATAPVTRSCAATALATRSCAATAPTASN